eukprot:CAMPEP_0119314074 /NCGR_PEP_ID=MMETSP1333-20130426/31579_1 /TAXON_ID=418940 /ORGANISM="Scyphosphaera apsteinii, Strain RCC1455" /LENGTH=399 /DNA_ID=CAMNT_0007319111 /DNA_START=12 /DNA_END=1211 /DNA_ORIENTATION=+
MTKLPGTAMLFVVAAASETCSDLGETCMNTRCCKDPGHGCYRRMGTGHGAEDAVCRPLSASCSSASEGVGVDAGWRCPGWSTCANAYGTCTLSGCCQESGFECKKKPQVWWAQCRPTSASQDCVNSEEWLCPGWDKCGVPYGECFGSRCCEDTGGRDFGCFKAGYAQHATCRPLEPNCVDTEDLLCPGWDRCSSPGFDCTITHCCNHKGFSCYVKSHEPRHATCLRTDTCHDEWAGEDPACILLNGTSEWPLPPQLKEVEALKQAMEVDKAKEATLQEEVDALSTEIVGVVALCVAFAIIALVAILILWRRMRKHDTEQTKMLREALRVPLAAETSALEFAASQLLDGAADSQRGTSTTRMHATDLQLARSPQISTDLQSAPAAQDEPPLAATITVAQD